MKIGFDAKRLYNNFTGLGNYSRTLLTNLATYLPDDEYYLYTPRVRINPETEPFLQSADFRTVIHKGCCKDLWRTSGIKKDLRRDGIQIYHGLSHELPLGIQKTNVRSVVTIHDVVYKTFPEMFPAIERRIYDRKYKHSCSASNRIIAISQSTKSDLIRLLGVPEEKIDVVYQAINPAFYTMQSPDKARELVRHYGVPQDFVLSVGTINSRKNLMGIMKAYRLIPKDLLLPIVVIGEGGKYKEEVMRFAEANDLTKYMIMIDSLTSSGAMQAFYQCATMLIYPSFYEGFGLPVTEALLCRTPVITSNISSLPEAGGEGAAYVDPSSPEDIAATIEKVLTDTEMRNNMVEVGYRYAHEKFDPERLTRQVGELYNSLATE